MQVFHGLGLSQPQQSSDPVSATGLDIGKNAFHLIGLAEHCATSRGIFAAYAAAQSPIPIKTGGASTRASKPSTARRLVCSADPDPSSRSLVRGLLATLHA